VITNLIDIIAGARPNFMKIAPVIEAIVSSRSRGGSLGYRLIHTGQHYDRAMSGTFFEQLGIPEPDVNLEVGSGTHAEQTGAIMACYEKVLQAERPAATVVVGDVNSTMACAITARKMGVPVAHVEAGIRSRDWSMPEEINRVVTDSISNWFFTTSENANHNLLSEGVDSGRIHFVGNTMIDTLLRQLSRLRPAPELAPMRLVPRGYLVLTLHRPANVDRVDRLRDLLGTLSHNSGDLPVVFPVHPRTSRILADLPDRYPNLHQIPPLGYLEFIHLVRDAKAVVTDSGGITEETTVLGVPCLTLRDNTERPETVTLGTNELIGTNPACLPPALERVLQGQWKQGRIPPLWDGRAAERIVATLEEVLAKGANQ
jgi:UDP-N-acetylglucosamine 2-epimerase (non-hydrolysing)